MQVYRKGDVNAMKDPPDLAKPEMGMSDEVRSTKAREKQSLVAQSAKIATVRY